MVKETKKAALDAENPDKNLTCGIIMPISSSDRYPSEHWKDVKDMLEESILDAGFKPNLVSDATDAGWVHQRIIENIYANPIVVCDISSRNPNVMFELGVRLAFDKPVVIVRDDETERIFDTDIIEYLLYPKSLRYSKIQLFKKQLTAKITATHEKFADGKNSFFIKNFKDVTPKKLEGQELDSTQLILRAIEGLKFTGSKREVDSLPRREYEIYTEEISLSVLRSFISLCNGDLNHLKMMNTGELRDIIRHAIRTEALLNGMSPSRSILISTTNRIIGAIGIGSSFEEALEFLNT